MTFPRVIQGVEDEILRFAQDDIIRPGSNELDSSSSQEQSSLVMLSAAKHLAASSLAKSRVVMLSTAKHLAAHRATDLHCAQGDIITRDISASDSMR